MVVSATNTGGNTTATSTQTATILYATPVNTVLPAITGTPYAGQLLTSSTGTWTGGGIAYTYQWRQCNAAGEACTNISGATSSTYTAVAGDSGHTIRVIVTATNTGGATPATSAQTTLVGSGVPVNTTLPTITGTAQQGQTLTASTGIWNYTPTGYTYQWQDCNSAGEACAAITGATAATYTLAETDVGKTIRVVVTATNSFGSTPATSEKTATVLYATPVNTGLPVISGTVQQGKMLSTTNGSWTGSGLSYAYQWQDCNSLGEACAAIGGATASGYTLQASDVGKTIRVVVTASNTGGATPATSEKTATVLIEAPVNTVLPLVTGTAQQGQTLSSTNGTWNNSPTGYTYQWQDCNAAGEAARRSAAPPAPPTNPSKPTSAKPSAWS